MDLIKFDALISLISFGKPMLTNVFDKFSWIAETPISLMFVPINASSVILGHLFTNMEMFSSFTFNSCRLSFKIVGDMLLQIKLRALSVRSVLSKFTSVS